MGTPDMRTAIITRLRAGLFALCLLPILALMTGCPAPTSPSPESSGAVDPSGLLVIKGSDTLLPLSQEWAQEFKKKHPNANITVTGGGTGTGIVALINGTANVANASRAIKDAEKKQAEAKGTTITEVPVARDGITIVINPKNPIKEITLDQLKGIYTGQINNWKEIGGPDQEVVASGRDTASGTYAYFQEEVLGEEEYRQDMISNVSNNAIAQDVEKNVGGIGYIGVAYAHEFTRTGKVKEVPVAFKTGEPAILPTPENILNGKYPISRELFNYTLGLPQGITKEYLDYVTSPEGQAIVKKQGFITLK